MKYIFLISLLAKVSLASDVKSLKLPKFDLISSQQDELKPKGTLSYTCQEKQSGRVFKKGQPGYEDCIQKATESLN